MRKEVRDKVAGLSFCAMFICCVKDWEITLFLRSKGGIWSSISSGQKHHLKRQKRITDTCIKNENPDLGPFAVSRESSSIICVERLFSLWVLYFGPVILETWPVQYEMAILFFKWTVVVESHVVSKHWSIYGNISISFLLTFAYI